MPEAAPLMAASGVTPSSVDFTTGFYKPFFTRSTSPQNLSQNEQVLLEVVMLPPVLSNLPGVSTRNISVRFQGCRKGQH
ncbi:MAG: hypothetical protein IAF08_09350 [Rhizobacter sp.]|nr:hypothetical protein [Chlorobiales bacterium]